MGEEGKARILGLVGALAAALISVSCTRTDDPGTASTDAPPAVAAGSELCPFVPSDATAVVGGVPLVDATLTMTNRLPAVTQCELGSGYYLTLARDYPADTPVPTIAPGSEDIVTDLSTDDQRIFLVRTDFERGDRAEYVWSQVGTDIATVGRLARTDAGPFDDGGAQAAVAAILRPSA